MREANYNTAALMSALKSDIEPLRKMATELIVRHVKRAPSQAAAAEELHTSERSMRSMIRLIRQRDPKLIPRVR